MCSARRGHCLTEEYDVSHEECESQVRSFLDMLKKEELID
ncbi:PqqD family peptide modification chaperone [Bacillus sp. D386]